MPKVEVTESTRKEHETKPNAHESTLHIALCPTHTSEPPLVRPSSLPDRASDQRSKRSRSKTPERAAKPPRCDVHRGGGHDKIGSRFGHNDTASRPAAPKAKRQKTSLERADSDRRMDHNRSHRAQNDEKSHRDSPPNTSLDKPAQPESGVWSKKRIMIAFPNREAVLRYARQYPNGDFERARTILKHIVISQCRRFGAFLFDSVALLFSRALCYHPCALLTDFGLFFWYADAISLSMQTFQPSSNAGLAHSCLFLAKVDDEDLVSFLFMLNGKRLGLGCIVTMDCSSTLVAKLVLPSVWPMAAHCCKMQQDMRKKGGSSHSWWQMGRIFVEISHSAAMCHTLFKPPQEKSIQ